MAKEIQKTWEERITRAKKIRKEWFDQFRVGLGRDYFEGKQNPGYPPEEWITINKIYAHLMAELPSLYSVDPYFYVKLKKSFDTNAENIAVMEGKGRIRQAMLNYLKGEIGLKSKARLGIMDSHFSYGVLKVRRASDQQVHPQAGEEIQDEDGNAMPDPETGEPQVYPKTLPVNERYELDRIHPDDILWDEDAGPLEDSWGWVAQHIQLSKTEALGNPHYRTTVVQAMQGKDRNVGDKSKRTVVRSKAFGKKKRDKKNKSNDDMLLDFWEIYDIKTREWLTVGEDADDLVAKPKPLPAGIEKHPFSFLRFTLRDNSPYPIPPVSPALDPQKEYCLSRSRILTHRKRFNRKYEVDVNKLVDPETDLSKIENGDDGTIVSVNALGAVNPIKDAPLDQASYLELGALNNDLVEVMGTGGTARGVADADSATEASLIDKRLDIREGDKLSMVVDWATEVAKKLDQLVQVYIDAAEAVRVTGPEGEQWVQITKADYEDIAGEYEYAVNLGASRPRLPEIERSQWIAFMSQVVIPFPHILTKPSVMKRMAEMFHIEDDAALEEFRQLGEAILEGSMPMPGNQGGGGGEVNPVAAILGKALGNQGGTNNGGGAPTVNQ